MDNVRANLGTDSRHPFRRPHSKSTGSAIGDGVEQISVAGLHDNIEDHLFCDGVADLHRSTRETFAFTRQLSTAKCRAVNPIATVRPPSATM